MDGESPALGITVNGRGGLWAEPYLLDMKILDHFLLTEPEILFGYFCQKSLCQKGYGVYLRFIPGNDEGGDI
jgi:hypothetical protein